MRLPFVFILAAAIAASGSRGNAQAPASGEAAAVRSAVERYLHGLKYNDVTSFQASFWPDARLYWIKKDGSLGQLTQAEWYRGFEKVAGQEEPGDLRIVSVDVTDDAASVKVEEVYSSGVYVDYLNLLRFGAEWRIMNKVYTHRPR